MKSKPEILTAIALVSWLLPVAAKLPQSLTTALLSGSLGAAVANVATMPKALKRRAIEATERDLEDEILAHQMLLQLEARKRDISAVWASRNPIPEPIRLGPTPQPQHPQQQPALEGGYIGQNTIASSAAPSAPVPVAGNVSPWNTIAPDLEGYFAILLYGSQGSGKTTIANWIISRRRSNGHRIIVLDPHRELGQWEGCEVVGDGMDYESIDAKLLALMAEVKERYRRRSTAKGARFEPITIVAEELTLWGEHCENVSLFLKSALADFRKIGLHLILIAHGKTNTILGGSKGTAATREATLLEVKPLAVPDPRSPSGVRAKGEALVKMPNETDVVVVAVPDLTAPPPTAATPPTAPSAPPTAPPTAAATAPAPAPATAALERALSAGPTDLHWKAIEFCLSRGGWVSLRDIQRGVGLPNADVTRGLVGELVSLELGEVAHDPKYDRYLFQAFEPSFDE